MLGDESMEGLGHLPQDGDTVEMQGTPGGRGGNVSLTPGKGGNGNPTGQDGSVIFNTPAGEEMMRVSSDGFYVRGVKVPQDENEALAVYTQFKLWLATATAIASPPTGDGQPAEVPPPQPPDGIETDGADS